MEDTYIVIMMKNGKTGFLETELGSYKLDQFDSLIYNIYAVEREGQVQVDILLSTEKELADWEFEAVYDYYDLSVFNEFAIHTKEIEDSYNPVWIITIPFYEEEEEMEKLLRTILGIHQKELTSVYEAIEDAKNEYI